MAHRMFAGLRRVTLLSAGGAVLLQTTSCQTTAQELLNSLLSSAVTNLVTSLVFGAFGLP